MYRRSVLISGAGIAGPTLAYWLKHFGFQPTLIERAPRFREGGYMIDFWGLGYDVAERMGILPRLREVGYAIEKIKFVDERNEVRSELGGQSLRNTLGGRFISLPRGDLAKAIYDTIASGTETIFGDRVVALREEKSGIEVSFEHSDFRRFDLVVGCDGLHSEIREMVFGPEEQFRKYLGYGAASFLTSGYSRRDEQTYWSFGAPGLQISRYALRGNHTAFLFVFAREKSVDLPVDNSTAKSFLRETFSREGWIEIPEIMECLEKCDEIYFDSVSQIHMPAWSRGRTALVGDAAYCPSLLAGEGSSFAMAGAFIMAGELWRAEGDPARAFSAYEKRFRGFIEKKQRAAERFATSFAPRTRLGLFVRDLVLRATSLPVAGRWLLPRFADDLELPAYG